MAFLAIETSSTRGSLALLSPDGSIGESFFPEGLLHGREITRRLEETLAVAKLGPRALEGIAVGLGPGSFTGLRVGVTAAKTLGFALRAPTVGESSLRVIAGNALRAIETLWRSAGIPPGAGGRGPHGAEGLTAAARHGVSILTALDARHGLFFAAAFEVGKLWPGEPEAEEYQLAEPRLGEPEVGVAHMEAPNAALAAGAHRGTGSEIGIETVPETGPETPGTYLRRLLPDGLYSPKSLILALSGPEPLGVRGPEVRGPSAGSRSPGEGCPREGGLEPGSATAEPGKASTCSRHEILLVGEGANALLERITGILDGGMLEAREGSPGHLDLSEAPNYVRGPVEWDPPRADVLVRLSARRLACARFHEEEVHRLEPAYLRPSDAEIRWGKA